MIRCRSVFMAVLVLVCGWAPTVLAAEITVLSTPTFEPVFREVIAAYQQASGDRVQIRYGAVSVLQREIEGGASFDIAVLLPDNIARLSAAGKIRAGSAAEIARALLGVAVRPPVTRDIRTADDLRAAILSAKALSYGPDSASGRAFLAVIERLNLSREVADRLVATSGNPVAAIARGEADLTVITVPNIIAQPGIALAGLLPAELQSPTTFTAAASAGSTEAAAASRFLLYLRSETFTSAMSKAGLTPP